MVEEVGLTLRQLLKLLEISQNIYITENRIFSSWPKLHQQWWGGVGWCVKLGWGVRGEGEGVGHRGHVPYLLIGPHFTHWSTPVYARKPNM